MIVMVRFQAIPSINRSDFPRSPGDQAPRNGLSTGMFVVVRRHIEECGDVVELAFDSVDVPLEPIDDGVYLQIALGDEGSDPALDALQSPLQETRLLGHAGSRHYFADGLKPAVIHQIRSPTLIEDPERF